MHLIYVDEYGTSGGRLDNPKEAYFALTALLVDERHWRKLENDILALKASLTNEIEKAIPGFDKQSKVEFHAAELFQGKGFYKALSLSRRLEYGEMLLKIGVENKVKYQIITVEKSMILRFHQVITENLNKWSEEPWWLSTVQPTQIQDLTLRRITPFTYAFTGLIEYLEDWLSSRGKRGMLIIDEDSQHRSIPNLRVYGDLRLDGHVKQLVSAPFFASSHAHAPMQLADTVSYLCGRYRMFDSQGEKVNPPIIEEWIFRYIKDFALSDKGPFTKDSRPEISVRILEELVPYSSKSTPEGRFIEEWSHKLVDAAMNATYMIRHDQLKAEKTKK